jgi:hypothetical protein
MRLKDYEWYEYTDPKKGAGAYISELCKHSTGTAEENYYEHQQNYFTALPRFILDTPTFLGNNNFIITRNHVYRIL